MKGISVSIVIPAYNEQASLGGFVNRVFDVCQNVQAEVEVILCNDASTDNTKAVAEELRIKYPQMRVIHHEVNQGLFKTFDELYHASTKDYVLLLPGDGQWDPGVLPEALTLVPAYDVVIAARRNKQYSLGRHINSWLFNRLVRRCFGIELYDIGSVKLVRREIFHNVPVRTQSAFTEAERLIKAHRLQYRIGVVWVQHHARLQGRGRGASPDKIIRALWDLIRFRFL